MLATLFIPAIQDFLLPALKDTWRVVLEKRQDLDKAARGADNTARAMEAMEEIDKAIMFFEDLIEDVVDHYKIVN
jgi:hypothetical protein